ncbi:MAG: alpha/beta hydrolase [Pseudomonadota bacterium]
MAQQLRPSAHITSPRGDVSEYGALRFFKRTGEGVYDMKDLSARTAAMAQFVSIEKAAVDADKAIGLGYSNGANILAAVALERPELLNDIILLHPLIPWQPDPQPGLKGRRILITAGERDPICPAPMTQAFADYLHAQGADVSLHWHVGGHEIAESELDAVSAFIAT